MLFEVERFNQLKETSRSSTRAASTSVALQGSLLAKHIQGLDLWAHETPFTRHYHVPIQSNGAT